VAVILAETIAGTQKSMAHKVNHLEILNHIGRSLASSLEIEDVIALVCEALQTAFHADTYYVGLLQGDSLMLELFYDDGEFYPKTLLPLENTLAGHVLRTRQSLRMTDLPKDRIRMNLPLFIVGKPKTSLSWMGIPMESGGEILGIMAVASYKRNAFSQADLNLLKNLTSQAALAIDNARHHEDVERRSRLDSLTGVLNHGSFLKSLEEKTAEALANGTTLSVIMMDIDHFKQFNDDHGHLVGDQVLCLVTDTIRRNIKSTDLVGRWGGEEFAVALPNAGGEEAVKIAQRLQKSMAQLYLASHRKQVIAAPTLSQGIAVFPGEASEVYPLVDLADQRLYRAKERGRNQIEPQEGFWTELSRSGEEETAPPV
ncbi:MAG TPA: sensor domain-containing diguanylate cyclase, partial [Anaerolineaceae bacterium]|nr:sensor domain-containing diguanylate cyclase [Anaerolineaceae bacterium]